ncbi:MAG: MucBP domain-containing protein, partial [Clostridia bacterium]
DVIVKDTIPAGTTFVEGSIKIDNVADSTKTATDLANGISVTVGVDKEVVVEFKVKVNKQIDGTKIKNTAYINQNGEDKKVPEEPEHTYVEPKEEQSISKNGTATIESLDQEITYNISYTARITDYSGRAAVKLVDKLPYAIDEAKSDLAGGTYDAQAQTITWEETVENIQITEEKEVTINKIIKVVYTGINQGTTAIKNIVTGQIEYETPVMTSNEVTANSTTTTGFTVNVQVSKVWEDDSNKLGQRPTKVVFKLHGSDGSEYTLELAKPGTQGSTTTQDSTNPNKWNDIFTNLPKYDSNNQEIVYTITEEEKTEGDLKYYESSITDKTVTNTNKYGKVTVHHYIMNTDGSTTTTRVPDTNGTEIADVVIEGKEGNPYTTEETKNINEKYELVAEKLPANATGIIEKYNEEKPQEVIYYYRLKPAKVLINYLEKDSNEVLSTQERITGYVDNSYNTNIDHRKETIQKDGKTYTLVKDSGNTDGIMTVADTTVTYYYLQNTKATVRYVERDPETGDIVKDLEEPTVKEGIVGDKFVTNEKAFIGYKLVEEPEHKTINMTKEEQTLIYYYEPVYTGLIENHIDDKTGKILETKTYEIQVGQDYNIPSKEFEGYDLVEEKLPANAEGTMGEEVVTVNYYYIKKAVLEVNYIDIYTNKPLIGQIVDNTKHEGDLYTTEQKTFENYDLVEVPSNASGTIEVETDEEGNITNNRTVVTYYYTQRAIIEEHHIDILTGKDIEEPTIHNGHVGDKYDIPSKEFLSYKLIEEDEEGSSMLPTNATGIMTEGKIVVNYYYNQPAKVIVHYVEKATGKELEETNPETGELQQALVIIEGFNQDEYETTAKEFEYYTLIEKPQEEQGKMKVEITKDEEGNNVVNNTIELYYYYEAKPFNIGVEKEITGIIVNGERRAPTSGKLEKVEIYRKSTEDTSVQVEYKIKVMNTGEVSGNATIEENIPAGMSLANNDGTWEEQEGKLIKVIPELGPGETKEYTVLLNWEQSGNNMGEKANEVKLVETGNVPGFVDNNDKDNTSNANVIISVETGELPIGLILALVGLIGLETITLRYAVVLTKRQKRSKKQNVTKK